jgi:MFS family permease
MEEVKFLIPVEVGDILRFYNGDFENKYTIILIRYTQTSSVKQIKEIIEIDYTIDLRNYLFGTITEPILNQYVTQIRSIPHGPVSEDIKNSYKSKKTDLQNKYNMKINISRKKSLLFWGMLLQGSAILGFIWAQTFFAFASLSVVLGLGTAVVYPTFLAAIADNTHPSQRAQSIGVFRLWRDLGYAVGALLTGILVDVWSANTAILAIGSITILSAFVILLRIRRVS